MEPTQNRNNTYTMENNKYKNLLDLYNSIKDYPSYREDRNFILKSFLKELAEEVYEGNKSRGFWDTDQDNFPAKIALMHSELSEALEGDRKGIHAQKNKYFSELAKGVPFEEAFRTNIKESVEDELADTVIRILDWCGATGIDIGWHIQEKLKYNDTRGRLHGGKKY